MGKKIKNIVKKIAPVALPILGSMIPGVGPVLGAALGGAAGGLVSGGGIKGALINGGLGAAGAGLLGSATGGGGLSSLLSGTGKGALGIYGGLGPGAAAAAGSAASAAAPVLTSASGGLSGLLSGSGLSNLSSFAHPAASIFSGLNDKDSLDDAEQAMLQAQGRAESYLTPYSATGQQANQQLSDSLAAGFNPGDLTQDPGYQFQLQQGMGALNKSLAAQGLGQSGAAIKAAQEYGQGLAGTTYNDAYNRWLQKNSQLAGLGGQGLTAAGAMGDYAIQGGNTTATGELGRAELLNKNLAGMFATPDERIAAILSGRGYI